MTFFNFLLTLCQNLESVGLSGIINELIIFRKYTNAVMTYMSIPFQPTWYVHKSSHESVFFLIILFAKILTLTYILSCVKTK